MPAREQAVEPHEKRFWKVAVETAVLLMVAILLTVLVQSFLIKAYGVTSSSMSPTIMEGDRVIMDRTTYYLRKPRRGDIVLFRFPPTSTEAMNTTNPAYWPFEQIAETLHLAHRTPSPPYVKRVIATEGETVEFRMGRLYVDGRRIVEKHRVADTYDMPPTRIPQGQLFVMGDNRPNSSDSRVWGLVPVRSVIGRAVFILWPPSRFGSPLD